ncbi:MAG: aminotransferase class I/II-fold pyridoxal phosphate-dependent enzyme, partial [Candidatus Portiera sp.]|nr:aminotransferase class I/II-fold pyridoxal phosphate-dependent enzyme [Portiera sp.]
MASKKLQKQTQAIRCQTKRSAQKEHSAPIYLTSSYIFDDAEHARALFARERSGNNYGRYHNPNASELANKIAILEETETGICFATGMAAIFNSIMGHCKSGDKVVASRCLFGSTVQILTRMLPKWGMSHDFVANNASMEEWSAAFTDDTKLCIIETPANPTLEVIDIAALADLCHSKDIILLVDNAYATPFLQNPIALGADMVMHSATKYIDGQGRCLGGIVAGSKKMMEPLEFLLRHAGAAISPFNAWILSKSLEHLDLRMTKHSENALTFAEYLSAHPKVAEVHYPFLSSSPFHKLASKQMRAGGGTLSFTLKVSNKSEQLKEAMQVLDGLSMCSLSANLGDTRTIVTHPAT